MQPLHLAGLSQAELTEFVASVGEPAFRARQIFGGIHNRRLQSLAEMADLPKELRAKLSERATVSTLTLESRYLSPDGTRLYLLRTHNKLPVEPGFSLAEGDD